MNSSQINKISKLNNIFYTNLANKFSKTRNYYWAGWKNLIPYFTKIKNKPIRVLDLGCGNGRLFSFLCQNIQSSTFEYLGIDNSADLLKIAKDSSFRLQTNNKFSFKKSDILKQLPYKNTFNFVACFGVTHHIPGNKFRLNWFLNLSKLVNKGSYIALSFWYPNIAKALPESPSYFEQNDYLFNFDSSEETRYVHIYNKEELDKIVSLFKECGLILINKYKSDFSTNSYNLYYVFKSI